MSRPAVFLDRDGTLIVEREYLADPEGVELVTDATPALERLRDAGIPYVIVTNQSGIARGLYSEDDYRRVDGRLQELLRQARVPPLVTLHCPHHPGITGPCACRKPGTALHRRAAADEGLDLARSWYVGDKASDVLPALELGGQGILVRTGYGRLHEREGLPPSVRVVDDLPTAVARVLASDRRR